MAVDVSEVRSPGWWMHRLGGRLKAERKRLQLLQDWYDGNPPVASDDENYRRYREMARQSRTNLAALAVEARRDRMRPRAIRTSVDADLEGDDIAWRLWKASNLIIESGTCHRMQLALSRCYVVVGLPGAQEGRAEPRATVEDPREVISATDAFGRTIAALKLAHDDIDDLDIATLWLPGVKHVALRERRESAVLAGRPVEFSASAFTINDGREERWDDAAMRRVVGVDVPVVIFDTEDGKGVFEKHLGLLERIDRGTFRRDSIALLQAFRQRAVVGDLDEAEDERAGVTVTRDDLDASADDGDRLADAENVVRKTDDLDDVLSADPGALWTLPEGVKLWESGQVDLTPLQTSKRDDVKEFAAVTRTPLSMVTPDAAAQSAEGASLQREGLTFATEDLRERAGASWGLVTSLMLYMAGEDARADIAGIVMEWAPAERHSLGERGAAAVAAKNSGVPWSTRMSDIWGFDAEKVSRMRDERLDDLLFDVANGAPAPAAELPAGA